MSKMATEPIFTQFSINFGGRTEYVTESQNTLNICEHPSLGPFATSFYNPALFAPRVNKTTNANNKEIWVVLQIVHMSHIRTASRAMLFKIPSPFRRGKFFGWKESDAFSLELPLRVSFFTLLWIVRSQEGRKYQTLPSIWMARDGNPQCHSISESWLNVQKLKA